MGNKKLFDLIKLKKFKELYNILKNDKDNEIDINISDKHNNYIINYIINYNEIELLKLLQSKYKPYNYNLDNEGRSILYNPIKFGYNDICDEILNYDNIGIDIINIFDKYNNNSFHYCIIFNNLYVFKKLYKMDSNIFILSGKNDNLIDLCFKYQRNNFLIYIIDNEISKGNYNLINLKNESVLYQSLVYDNMDVFNHLIKKKEYISNVINNQENEYGLTVLHQIVITDKNNLFNTIFNFTINVNIQDKLGNTPAHYAIMENNITYLNFILNNSNINLNFNLININGDTLLHLYLKNSLNYVKIFNKIIENTNLNIQNNDGDTCLHLIYKYNQNNEEMMKDIFNKSNNDINIFILNNNNNSIFDKIKNNDKLIDIFINNYYKRLVQSNNLKNIKLNWEVDCINKKLDENTCKQKIKKKLYDDNNSIISFKNNKISLNDNIIVTNNCFYTGSSIDIIFGLLYLKNISNIDIIVSYPLSKNQKLFEYYEKSGIEYIENQFNNIEIFWVFQKLIFILDFDNILLGKISSKHSNRFIIIPLGIETAKGSHANMIIIDKKNKIIERFEPNGANEPLQFNYNSSLLDNLLKSKFNTVLSGYKYIKPKDYLPVIGFQMLEISDEECKEIGDPNGFCAVWCVWYASYRIKNPDIDINILVKELINNIRLENISFKNVIRNFSKKISNMRDDFIKKYDLSINDFIFKSIDNNTFKNIEKKIYELL